MNDWVKSQLNAQTLSVALMLIFSTFLLSWNLDGVPVGINQDESSVGYDAHCIGETGKDHHGVSFPIMFESYGDYVSPLYTYIAVPFVKTLGLSMFSVRLPVAILMAFTSLLFYFLIRRWTDNRNIAFLGMIILATAPWALTLGRWGVQPSIVPFFMLLFALNFCRLTRSGKGWNAILIFGLAAVLLTYSYPIQKLFVPLMLIGLIILLKTHRRRLFLSSVIWLMLTSPIYLAHIMHPEVYGQRMKMVGLGPFGWESFKGFVFRYFEYFLPQMYFGNGDSEIIHRVQEYPSVYAWLAPFFYFGLILLFVSSLHELFPKLRDRTWIVNLRSLNPIGKTGTIFVLLWTILFPIGASLTIHHMVSTRVAHGLPLVLLLSLMGMYFIYQLLIKNRALKVGVISVFVVACTLNTTFFIHSYHNNHKNASKEAYHFGLQEAIEFCEGEGAQIVIVGEGIHVPDILFHMNYNPLMVGEGIDHSNFTIGKFTNDQEVSSEVPIHLFRKGNYQVLQLDDSRYYLTVIN